MDRSAIQLLAFLSVMVFILDCPVTAHSPSGLQVTADVDAGSVLVTLDHPVDDPSRHYVNAVVIERNGAVVDTRSYTSQPSAGTFSYRYSLSLQEGDVIGVTARCNIGGSITRKITVPAPAAQTGDDGYQPRAGPYAVLWPVHAGLMVAAFLSFLSAALFPIFWKGTEGWFRRHTRLAAAGAVLTLAALGTAFLMVHLSGGPNFRVPHAFSGILVFAVLLATVSLALLRNRLRPHTALILTAHRWAGRALILLMAVTILSGLSTAGILS